MTTDIHTNIHTESAPGKDTRVAREDLEGVRFDRGQHWARKIAEPDEDLPAHLRARHLQAFQLCLARSGMSEEGFVGALTTTSLSRLESWTLADLERLLAACVRHGLDPTTGREAYLVPDSAGAAPMVVVSVDGWSRIMNAHEQFAGMRFRESTQLEDGLPSWTECTIHRWDRRVATTVREHLSEVRGMSTAWVTHPRRMLRHKAMVQCARLAFGLTDIVDPDEAYRASLSRAAQTQARQESAQPKHARLRQPMGAEGLKSALGL